MRKSFIEKIKIPAFQSAVLICFCFLLSSTCWLSWEYHLLTQVPSGVSDICTMVIGYFLQAAGIGIFATAIYKKESYARGLFISALLVNIVCTLPAVLSSHLVGTLVFGFLMNLTCGMIAGYYLFHLSKFVEKDHRTSVFAVGYGISILVSWLLSLSGENIYYSGKVVLITVILTGIILLTIFRQMAEQASMMRNQWKMTG